MSRFIRDDDIVEAVFSRTMAEMAGYDVEQCKVAVAPESCYLT